MISFKQFLLLEASFDSKVTSLQKKFPDIDIKEYLNQFRTIAGNNSDRIMWFLNYLDEYFKSNPAVSFEHNNNIKDLLEKFKPYNLSTADNTKSISTVTFGKKTLDALLTELDKNNIKTGVTPSGNDQVILECKGGNKWWYVDRSYCPEEARSGKHCGNSESLNAKHGNKQRILSLRTKTDEVILTFILFPNDKLGEMKGRANTTPLPKYHPEIIQLLIHPKFEIKNSEGKIIRTFKIEGFQSIAAAVYNFSIFDLNDKNIHFIDKERPDLIKSQILISPSDILKAPNDIKLKYKNECIPEIKNVIEDDTLNNWIKLIDTNKKLITLVPEKYWTSFPDFEKILREYIK